MIELLSKPNCQQCNATKRWLKAKNIPFTEVDMTIDDAALARAKEAGFQQAPVVFAWDDAWSGFRPDKLQSLVQ